MAGRQADAGVSPAALIVGTVLLVLGLGTLIWFAIPDPDARHHFSSPSGQVSLDIGETCGETGCRRAMVAEFVEPDGRKVRRGCAVPLTEDHPVLLNLYPLWSHDEGAVELVYADAAGEGGKFRIELTADCTDSE